MKEQFNEHSIGLLCYIGSIGNDTVMGDPLFTVPIYDQQDSTPVLDLTTDTSPPSLCFEIHGATNKIFNLISDHCTSVNAHYAPMDIPERGNIIDSVGIRAVDTAGKCVNIRVSIESGCTPNISTGDGVTQPVTRYNSQGVSVSTHRNHRVRVSVPNCENVQLVMWVICESMNRQEMVKFVITRGINLRPTSHGLLGNQ